MMSEDQRPQQLGMDMTIADSSRAVRTHLVDALEPLTVERLIELTGATRVAVVQGLTHLAWSAAGRGLIARNLTSGSRFVAKARAAGFSSYRGTAPEHAISRADLKVLAVVAYMQPCSRAEIETLCGSHAGEAIETLGAHELVAGVADSSSDPAQRRYATTDAFLEACALSSLNELAPIELFTNDVLETTATSELKA